jgi:MFS transporter, CP family, cyanate transporter
LGFAAAEAGFHQGILQLSGIIGGLLCDAVLGRCNSDQHVIALVIAPLPLVGIIGEFAWPGWATLWNVSIGLVNSSAFVLALALFALRTADHQQAAALSGMAQSVGY